jgi:hypothetical protein
VAHIKTCKRRRLLVESAQDRQLKRIRAGLLGINGIPGASAHPANAPGTLSIVCPPEPLPWTLKMPCATVAYLDTVSMMSVLGFSGINLKRRLSVNNEPYSAAGIENLTAVSTGSHYPSPAAPVNTFERLEEYKAVLEQLGRLSARRQNLNDVFVAINTIFLTAIGFLLFQSKFDSWWLVGVVSAITLAIMPINLTWRLAIDRYKGEIKVHVEYLSSIEREFRRRREANEGMTQMDEIQIGFYLYNTVRRRAHSGKSRIEKRLANYFIILYPLISLAAAALTYLVSNGLISSLGL